MLVHVSCSQCLVHVLVDECVSLFQTTIPLLTASVSWCSPCTPPPPSGYGMARQCMCRGCGRWLTSQLLLLSSLNGCTSVTETQLSCFMSLHSQQDSGSSRCVPVRLHSAPSDCCSGGYSDCRNPSVPPPHFVPRNTFGSEARCAGLHVCVAIMLLCSCCHARRASGLVL